MTSTSVQSGPANKTPRWSQAAVESAAKQNAFAKIPFGGELALTGAANRWAEEYHNKATQPAQFSHYFGFPLPSQYAGNAAYVAGIRTVGTPEAFSKVFGQIFGNPDSDPTAYGAYIRQNMADNGLPNFGLNSPQMNQIIQILNNSGYTIGFPEGNDEIKRQFNAFAFMLYNAFSPFTVNIPIKASKDSADQSPVLFFNNRGQLPDRTADFQLLFGFEAANRKARSEAKGAKSEAATKIADPFAVIRYFAAISMKNVSVVPGSATTGGVSVANPEKASARDVSGFLKEYNTKTADSAERPGKYLLVAMVTNGIPSGFTINEKGNPVGKSFIDLPTGQKVRGEYVYFNDERGQLRHLIARTTNPNWAEHMAAAARVLSGDNTINAQRVREQFARPITNLMANVNQTYVPGGTGARTSNLTAGTLPRPLTNTSDVRSGTMSGLSSAGLIPVGSPLGK